MEARSLLSEREWLFEELQVVDSKKESRWGLVFAHPARLSVLARRGWFTQFDATHKLNQWGHNMFSFLVRNEYNIWIPTAHLVVERENGEIIAEKLKNIKKWCKGAWKPRYVLTDDSAIEQRAIRLAFPRLSVGELEVEHLLCSVYSNRTLLRGLGSTANKPIYHLLKHAMYCVTAIKNRELYDQAVQVAGTIDPSDNTAKHVQIYWHQTASKWAMYARQHSPLLLHVTTTNSCEAWHRKLKSGAGLSKGQVASHGIYGMILNIMDAAKDVDSREEIARSQFGNRKLAVTKQYLEIGQLPEPVQKLLAVELDAVSDRIAKGKDIPSGFDETLRCQCKFYRQYLLPSRHIFHLDTELKVLTTTRWEEYLAMFGECGMEVYESMDTVWVEEDNCRYNAEKTSSMIRVRACVEQLQQQLYSIHELMDQLNLEDTVRSERIEE